jgi:pimeloyl-ACP methyl ester carboxylesterase
MRPDRTFQARGDGVNLQLAEWPGSGATVLCLPGLTANLTCFHPLAKAMQGGGHQVLAIDLRGRGLSDKPESGYSLDIHCRDIKAVMADLSLNKVILMGHSLGAYICLAFAAKYPEITQGIILLDGGAELNQEQWAKVSAGINPSVDRLGKVFESPEAYLDMVRKAPYFNPWNQTLEDYFRYDLEEVQGGVASRISPESIAEERANLAQIKPSELYPRVGCPVLILQALKGMLAADDLVLPTDALAKMLKAIPQASAVSLKNIHHFSLVFQPCPKRDQAVLKFLSEC